MRRLARSLRNAAREAAYSAIAPGLVLDPARTLANRSVLIVGPAAGVAAELAELDPSRYEVIVRMNRGIGLTADPSNCVGARTDLLFHNLKEDGPRSAGRLGRDLLDGGGVRHVIFPHAVPGQLTAILGARHRIRALDCQADLRLVPSDLYRRTARTLGGRIPTTGTVAIAFAAAGRPRRLAIAGFSFFQTRYQPGYNDRVACDADAAAWVQGEGAHDPARERAFVQERLAALAASGTEVVLGRQVRRFLDLSGAGLPVRAPDTAGRIPADCGP